MFSAPTLLITDSNLGDAAHRKVAGVCSNLTWISWRAEEADTRAAVIERIASGNWDVAISIYSDLVLSREALGAIGLPLNIHPALPHLRGMGYDLVPLIEKHPAVGATLHLMESRVDSGPIFDVHEAPVPPDVTYASLRAFNQALSLKMLDALRPHGRGRDPREIGTGAAPAGDAARLRWGSTYHSRTDIAALRQRHAEALGLEPSSTMGQTG